MFQFVIINKIKYFYRYQSHVQLQLNQISPANIGGVQKMVVGENIIQQQRPDPSKFQRNFIDGDNFDAVRNLIKKNLEIICLTFLFIIFQLKFLSFDDLKQRLSNIDLEMERDIDDLNRKYNTKRQPILDAMAAKKKRQQNLNNNLIKI